MFKSAGSGSPYVFAVYRPQLQVSIPLAILLQQQNGLLVGRSPFWAGYFAVKSLGTKRSPSENSSFLIHEDAQSLVLSGHGLLNVCLTDRKTICPRLLATSAAFWQNYLDIPVAPESAIL